MKFLLPIGLIALISLVVLLVIYILKPNYQQKMISSTFIWKLSLKYKKKRIPISKLRNILILLCQILILTIAALIIAKPVTIIDKIMSDEEKIIVLDASSGMFSESDGESRFNKAKTEIKKLGKEIFDKNGAVSLIYAGPTASNVVSREKDRDAFDKVVDELECSYGNADVEGAMKLAENLLDKNPDANVVYVTGTNYAAVSDSVEVVDVSGAEEWNAAVLDVRTEIVDGVYELQVDIACYGRDRDIKLEVDVSGINGTDAVLHLPEPDGGSVNCRDDKVYTVVYSYSKREYGENSVFVDMTKINKKNEGLTSNKFYSFKRIIAYIDEPSDSLSLDNEIMVYGGEMPTINIEYKSTNWNEFFRQSLATVGEALRTTNNLNVVTITKENKDVAETSGYDVYFFEHEMPKNLPKDGIVFMIDPDTSLDAGFTIKKTETISSYDGDGASLAIGDVHPITDGIDVSEIKLTEYSKVDIDSLDGYDVLMYYMGDPVVFVKNTSDTKIFVMAFDVHKSNIGLSWYFPQLIYQALNYFLPQTFDKSTYDVYDTITLNARGSEMQVVSPDDNEKIIFDQFPAELTVNIPGTYSVIQKLLYDSEEPRYQTESFYVRIPSLQSYITRTEDYLEGPNATKVVEKDYNDLLIYFAATMLALAFIEWWLQSKSGV